MMMSLINIEGSLQGSEHKDYVEVMRSVINKIRYTERENDTLKMVTQKNSKHDWILSIWRMDSTERESGENNDVP